MAIISHHFKQTTIPFLVHSAAPPPTNYNRITFAAHTTQVFVQVQHEIATSLPHCRPWRFGLKSTRLPFRRVPGIKRDKSQKGTRTHIKTPPRGGRARASTKWDEVERSAGTGVEWKARKENKQERRNRKKKKTSKKTQEENANSFSSRISLHMHTETEMYILEKPTAFASLPNGRKKCGRTAR